MTQYHSQEFATKDGHARRTVPDLVILNPRNIHQDLGGGIVEVDRFQNRSSVIGHADALIVLGYAL